MRICVYDLRRGLSSVGGVVLHSAVLETIRWGLFVSLR